MLLTGRINATDTNADCRTGDSKTTSDTGDGDLVFLNWWTLGKVKNRIRYNLHLIYKTVKNRGKFSLIKIILLPHKNNTF